MAEPFSIATGALQVASAGLKLANALYDYLESVKNAHKYIKSIAVEVRLTSSVLEQLGKLLEETETEKLCSKNIVTDAKAAFSGCEDAFREVDEAIRVLVKPPTNGTKNVSLSASLLWPFKKGRLEALQANLERLKTTLLLMLSVLGYARDKAAKTAAIETQSAIERLQIQNLIKAKNDAIERYEGFVLDFSNLQTTSQERPTLNSSVNYIPPIYQSNAFLHQPPLAAVPITASTNTKVPDTSADYPTYNPDRKTLLLQLDVCTSALWKLMSTIDTASRDLRFSGSTRTFEAGRVSESYHDLQTSIGTLLALDDKYVQIENVKQSGHSTFHAEFAVRPKPASTSIHCSFPPVQEEIVHPIQGSDLDGLATRVTPWGVEAQEALQPYYAAFPYAPPRMNHLPSDESRPNAYENAIRPRQEIAGPAYQDRTQSSTAVDIPNQASQATEYYKHLSPTHGHRATLPDDSTTADRQESDQHKDQQPKVDTQARHPLDAATLDANHTAGNSLDTPTFSVGLDDPFVSHKPPKGKGIRSIGYRIVNVNVDDDDDGDEVYGTPKHVRTEEPWCVDSVEDLVRRWTTVKV